MSATVHSQPPVPETIRSDFEFTVPQSVSVNPKQAYSTPAERDTTEQIFEEQIFEDFAKLDALITKLLENDRKMAEECREMSKQSKELSKASKELSKSLEGIQGLLWDDEVPHAIQNAIDYEWSKRFPDLAYTKNPLKSLSRGFAIWWFVWNVKDPQQFQLPLALTMTRLPHHTSRKNTEIFIRQGYSTPLDRKMVQAWDSMTEVEQNLTLRVASVASDAGGQNNPFARPRVPKSFAFKFVMKIPQLGPGEKAMAKEIIQRDKTYFLEETVSVQRR